MSVDGSSVALLGPLMGGFNATLHSNEVGMKPSEKRVQKRQLESRLRDRSSRVHCLFLMNTKQLRFFSDKKVKHTHTHTRVRKKRERERGILKEKKNIDRPLKMEKEIFDDQLLTSARVQMNTETNN